jgi:hypothetical protein
VKIERKKILMSSILEEQQQKLNKNKKDEDRVFS